MKLQPYHGSLGDAIDAAIQYLKDRGVEAEFENLREPFTTDGVPYSSYKESHCEIESLNGRKTYAFAHLSIWRSSSGQYEVNAYIL